MLTKDTDLRWGDKLVLYDGEIVQFIEKVGSVYLVACKDGTRKVARDFQIMKHYPSNNEAYGGAV